MDTILEDREAHSTVTIKYFDGSTRNTVVIDSEVPYPDGKLIVSRTDKAGIITHCNQSFIDMSGYSEEELIGQPHSILRHPDMPKAAFKDLWDTLQNNQKWHGYVKNLRKDGSYYWVYATAIPNIRNNEIVGYTSVRRKPSRNQINKCIELYKKMILEEQE